MKKIIVYCLFAFMAFAACRKSRTCTCSIKIVTTTTSTPQNGGAAVTSTSVPSPIVTERKYPATTRKNMIRYENCNSRIESATKTYTSTIQTGTVVTPVNVYEQNSADYDCEID